MKVRFVKQYSNHVGRVLRRYVVAGKPEVLPWITDVCVRESRGGPWVLSNAEAKAEAERRLLDLWDYRAEKVEEEE